MEQEEILLSAKRELEEIKERKAELEKRIETYECSALRKYEDTYAIMGHLLVHFMNVCPSNGRLIKFSCIKMFKGGYSFTNGWYGLTDVKNPFWKFLTKEEYEGIVEKIFCKVEDIL